MEKNIEFQKAYAEVLQADKTSRLDFLKQEFSNKVPSKETIGELLNIAIVDEFLAEYNYFASYNLSKTDGKNDFDPEFKQHQEEERDHRYKLVERLRELDLPVPTIPFEKYIEVNSNGTNWKQELDFNSGNILLRRLQQEEDAVKFYSFILGFIGLDKTETRDTTTYSLIRKIKGDEEEHIKDLRDLAIERNLIK